jgi:hypothetical protein
MAGMTVLARWVKTKFHSIFLPEYDLHKLEQFAIVHDRWQGKHFLF